MDNRIFVQKVLGLGMGMSLLLAATNGFAAAADTTAEYAIKLIRGCTVAATGQNFGVHVAGGSDLIDEPAGNLTVTCLEGTKYIVGVDKGLYFNAGNRNMGDGGGNTVLYELKEASTGNPVGDDNLNTIEPAYVPTTPWSGISGVGTGAPVVHDLKADVKLTGTAPGDYRDKVIVTVVWP